MIGKLRDSEVRGITIECMDAAPQWATQQQGLLGQNDYTGGYWALRHLF
jgi:hypothetical protein